MQRLVRSTLSGLFTMSLVAVSIQARAAEYGQIDLSNPAGGDSMSLHPGDSVIYDGPGAAINISAKGNNLNAEGVDIQAGSPVGNFTVGVSASDGGHVTLVDSQVLSHRTYALEARGPGSEIVATGTSLTSRQSFGAYAYGGGRITLDGGSITTLGTYGHGVVASGAGTALDAHNLSISTSNANGYGAEVSQRASMTLEAVTINTAGESASVLDVRGAGSSLAFIDSHGTSARYSGARLYGGQFSMLGGSLTAHEDAVYLGYDFDGVGSSADIRYANLSSSTGYGLNLNGDAARATLYEVSISTYGEQAGGVWMFMPESQLIADQFSISTFGAQFAHGLDNRAGQATLSNGTIFTHGENSLGLYLYNQFDSDASIEASNMRIETFGTGSFGALAQTTGADLRLAQSEVVTHGQAAHGLFVRADDARLAASSTEVITHGNGASALALGNGAVATLENSRLATHGDLASGVWSYVNSGTASNTLSLTGSQISTQDGAGLLASGGDHQFTLVNSSIVARAEGQEAQGIFLQTRQAMLNNVPVDTGQVSVEASGSTLVGDVLAQNGSVDLSLSAGSELTGALRAESGGRINSLLLDDSSRWNIRSDSTLGTLTNNGTLVFGAAGFQTLTVNDYIGNGAMVLSTYLGDDTSPSDRLVIDGGTASGRTAVRVLNAGGKGGLTQEGIPLVQAINGGTIAADAFYLDTGSSGYRRSVGSLSINGYEYSLVQGGNSGNTNDWYLTSEYNGPALPTDPPAGANSAARQVAPEGGAYIGTQQATRTMFDHGLQDRASKRSLGADRQDSGLWMRAQGRHDKGMRMAEGKVDIDSSSDVVQMGGALLRRPVGAQGALYAGLMAGYGDARIDSTSTLMRRDTNTSVRAKAHGKVSGYSAGVYGTFYADDVNRLGAYVDTWLQYGRYTNRLSSELGSADYDSNLWSASLESGYALAPFAADSPFRAWVVEPRGQLIYSRYTARDAELQDTRLRNGTADAWRSSIGVRLYQQPGQAADESVLRPFVETNWLHSEAVPSVRMGSNSFDARPSRDALELKVGAQVRVARDVELSSHLFGHSGSVSEYGYGGQLNLSYSW
ncbi:autotransporter outer membrane beta-barrel domain-containing protein [Pseudomonas sp. W17]|uniref:Autotransporter outer membrane beta-barrel domain-containing protein n=1 Tax=Pseudomonas sp. W17 TaxID=3144407 RepID=A0AAU7WQU9_9PSED|nr:autotransporter outer membrane beta-barrel domain-containing protein [Pseudomonas protegens]WRV89994.1 autotransporter outer membrane beta-barrel domain-containing protein [Pseudomonas protegens]